MLEKPIVLAVQSDYNLRNRRIKRRLWPIHPKDREVTRKDIQKEYKKTQKEFTEKYNFDFESSKPLEGKYKWTPTLESPISSPSCFMMIRDNEETCCSSSISDNQQGQLSHHVYNIKSTKCKRSNKKQTCMKGKATKIKNKTNINKKLGRSSFTYALRNKPSNSASMFETNYNRPLIGNRVTT